MKRRVVITGAGVLSPIGLGLEAYWQGLSTGRSGAAAITRFDASQYSTTFACELKDFDPQQWLSRPDIRRMDPFCQFGMVAAMMAIEQSGIDLEKVNLDRFGVITASGIGGLSSIEEAHGRLVEKGPGRIPPMFIPMMISDILPGQIAMRFGLKGPNYGTVSACASSSHAIGCAAMAIRSGQADRVLTGGSEASITPLGIGGFNALQALSTRNDAPQKASRPFDRDRDGFVMGEGAAMFLVESLEAAEERGATILAEISGCGFTADAHHLTAPAPEGEGAQRAMRAALADAGLEPGDIDHVNTHGTSTPAGDLPEIQAIHRVFGDHVPAINSTKSMTGHLLGAAGAVESLAVVLAIKNQFVPPTINLENPDPALELPIVGPEGRKGAIRHAISNTFGFGGHNASLLISEFIA
jgi:3-oxoacyl-[acyl-carrier-protein] synthase II